MIVGSAAMVWDRSPPPSCKRIIAPSPARLRIRLIITPVPGNDQSRASSFQVLVVRPSRLAFANTVVLTTPSGELLIFAAYSKDLAHRQTSAQSLGGNGCLCKESDCATGGLLFVATITLEMAVSEIAYLLMELSAFRLACFEVSRFA